MDIPATNAVDGNGGSNSYLTKDFFLAICKDALNLIKDSPSSCLFDDDQDLLTIDQGLFSLSQRQEHFSKAISMLHQGWLSLIAAQDQAELFFSFHYFEWLFKMAYRPGEQMAKLFLKFAFGLFIKDTTSVAIKYVASDLIKLTIASTKLYDYSSIFSTLELDISSFIKTVNFYFFDSFRKEGYTEGDLAVGQQHHILAHNLTPTDIKQMEMTMPLMIKLIHKTTKDNDALLLKLIDFNALTRPECYGRSMVWIALLGSKPGTSLLNSLFIENSKEFWALRSREYDSVRLYLLSKAAMYNPGWVSSHLESILYPCLTQLITHHIPLPGVKKSGNFYYVNTLSSTQSAVHWSTSINTLIAMRTMREGESYNWKSAGKLLAHFSFVHTDSSSALFQSLFLPLTRLCHPSMDGAWQESLINLLYHYLGYLSRLLVDSFQESNTNSKSFIFDAWLGTIWVMLRWLLFRKNLANDPIHRERLRRALCYYRTVIGYVRYDDMVMRDIVKPLLEHDPKPVILAMGTLSRSTLTFSSKLDEEQKTITESLLEHAKGSSDPEIATDAMVNLITCFISQKDIPSGLFIGQVFELIQDKLDDFSQSHSEHTVLQKTLWAIGGSLEGAMLEICHELLSCLQENDQSLSLDNQIFALIKSNFGGRALKARILGMYVCLMVDKAPLKAWIMDKICIPIQNLQENDSLGVDGAPADVVYLVTLLESCIEEVAIEELQSLVKDSMMRRNKMVITCLCKCLVKKAIKVLKVSFVRKAGRWMQIRDIVDVGSFMLTISSLRDLLTKELGSTHPDLTMVVLVSLIKCTVIALKFQSNPDNLAGLSSLLQDLMDISSNISLIRPISLLLRVKAWFRIVTLETPFEALISPKLDTREKLLRVAGETLISSYHKHYSSQLKPEQKKKAFEGNQGTSISLILVLLEVKHVKLLMERRQGLLQHTIQNPKLQISISLSLDKLLVYATEEHLSNVRQLAQVRLVRIMDSQEDLQLMTRIFNVSLDVLSSVLDDSLDQDGSSVLLDAKVKGALQMLHSMSLITFIQLVRPEHALMPLVQIIVQLINSGHLDKIEGGFKLVNSLELILINLQGLLLSADVEMTSNLLVKAFYGKMSNISNATGRTSSAHWWVKKFVLYMINLLGFGSLKIAPSLIKLLLDACSDRTIDYPSRSMAMSILYKWLVIDKLVYFHSTSTQELLEKHFFSWCFDDLDANGMHIFKPFNARLVECLLHLSADGTNISALTRWVINDKLEPVLKNVTCLRVAAEWFAGVVRWRLAKHSYADDEQKICLRDLVNLVTIHHLSVEYIQTIWIPAMKYALQSVDISETLEFNQVTGLDNPSQLITRNADGVITLTQMSTLERVLWTRLMSIYVHKTRGKGITVNEVSSLANLVKLQSESPFEQVRQSTALLHLILLLYSNENIMKWNVFEFGDTMKPPAKHYLISLLVECAKISSLIPFLQMLGASLHRLCQWSCDTSDADLQSAAKCFLSSAIFRHETRGHLSKDLLALFFFIDSSPLVMFARNQFISKFFTLNPTHDKYPLSELTPQQLGTVQGIINLTPLQLQSSPAISQGLDLLISINQLLQALFAPLYNEHCSIANHLISRRDVHPLDIALLGCALIHLYPYTMQPWTINLLTLLTDTYTHEPRHSTLAHCQLIKKCVADFRSSHRVAKPSDSDREGSEMPDAVVLTPAQWDNIFGRVSSGAHFYA